MAASGRHAIALCLGSASTPRAGLTKPAPCGLATSTTAIAEFERWELDPLKAAVTEKESQIRACIARWQQRVQIPVLNLDGELDEDLCVVDGAVALAAIARLTALWSELMGFKEGAVEAIAKLKIKA